MINAILILIKLIAAHLLGDFIFQSNKMCNDKCSALPLHRYSTLLIHALIQAALTYIFIFQWNNWVVPSVIAVSHFCIDWVKSKTKNKGLKTFLLDQLAHYIVLITIWWIYFIKLNHTLETSQYVISFKAWVIFTSFIAVFKPSSILIKLFLDAEGWTPKTENYQGLPNAGRWIGYLERFLILIFIFTNNIEGIGFLLAAKSIFRFGELNKAKDLKITEYVLIGTFLSFAMAIAVGYLALYVINFACE